LNPGRRGGKPATNRFSYGAAKTVLPITCKISLQSIIQNSVHLKYQNSYNNHNSLSDAELTSEHRNVDSIMAVKWYVNGERSRALRDMAHGIPVKIDNHEKSDRIADLLVNILNKYFQNTRQQ
jgi:hypothetical protein